MGPRSGDRGNSQTICPFAAPWVASMGPRSGDRGNLECIADSGDGGRLQWGRDLVIAEMETGANQDIVYGWLQWGRDLVIAEIWEAGRLIRLDKALQWGRDLVIAEMDRHK